jgi:hypothetical protein
VDFRKGIDGLTAVCRQVLGDNPLEGAVYVFRIAIVLMALAVWRDELRADQAHVMPELPHLMGPIVGALAGFHAKATGGKLCDKGQKLRSREFLTYHDIPLTIDPMQLKHIFCEIDPEYGNLLHCCNLPLLTFV